MSATAPKYSDVSSTSFGSGGAASFPEPSRVTLPRAVQSLMATHSAPVANTAALTASLAKDRVNGMLAVKLDDYSLWVWKSADATAADATHVAPTDVGAGAGRWVRAVAGPA